MAVITFNIPDSQIQRFEDGFASQYGYTETTVLNDEQIPNPESKLEFLKRMIAQFIVDSVHQAEVRVLVDVTTDVVGSQNPLDGVVTWEEPV